MAPLELLLQRHKKWGAIKTQGIKVKIGPSQIA
jgi:hypothetical protein